MEYNICGLPIDSDALYSKNQILDYLRENGEDDRALGNIREHYSETFGNELMWRYPISDGYHAGAFIVCCREGFLSLPYDCMDKEVYEILEPDKATLHDADSMQYFIDDWKLFSDDLLKAMEDILQVLKNKE